MTTTPTQTPTKAPEKSTSGTSGFSGLGGKCQGCPRCQDSSAGWCPGGENHTQYNEQRGNSPNLHPVCRVCGHCWLRGEHDPQG